MLLTFRLTKELPFNFSHLVSAAMGALPFKFDRKGKGLTVASMTNVPGLSIKVS